MINLLKALWQSYFDYTPEPTSERTQGWLDSDLNHHQPHWPHINWGYHDDDGPDSGER
jgi:hypothetical protein